MDEIVTSMGTAAADEASNAAIPEREISLKSHCRVPFPGSFDNIEQEPCLTAGIP